MNQHGIVHRLDQALKQLFPTLQCGTALLEIFQQFVDCRAQLLQRLGFAFEPDAAGGAGLEGQATDLLGEFDDGTLLAAGAQFATDLVVVDIPVAGGSGRPATAKLPRVVATEPPRPARPTPLRSARPSGPSSPPRPRSMPPSCWGRATTWARTGSKKR